MHGMKEMRDSLVTMVGRIRTGTEAIAPASIQMASGKTDLSSRTEQQASSLEEPTSSVEERTTAV
jgi:methyl-accepting chemotaxis protein